MNAQQVDHEAWVSVGEVARRYGVSRNLVYALVPSGALRSVRLGRRVLVAEKSLETSVQVGEEQ